MILSLNIFTKSYLVVPDLNHFHLRIDLEQPNFRKELIAKVAFL